ncbi:MAG: TRAP transporter small permease subunit [Rubrivivax sp.]
MLHAMRRALWGVCGGLLALLVLTPLAQILMRSVFNVPMAGAEELARYFLICLVFMGAPLVTQAGGQIAMRELQLMLPRRARFGLQLAIEAAGMAFFALVTLAAAVSIARNLRNQTATLEMPFWLFMAPLLLGAALLVLETAAVLAEAWRRGDADDRHSNLT